MTYQLSSLSKLVVQAEDLIKQPNANRLFIEVRLGTEPEEEHRKYRECHIFGAVYAQIRDVFASPPSATSGNLPLPSLTDLQAQLQRWSVDNHTEIILYGPSPALAARGGWVLRWAGLTNVKLLDGGLKSWVEAGGPVAQGDFTPKVKRGSSTLALSEGNMPSITVSEVEKLSGEFILIDARDEASFYSGRIPKAVNLPASEQWSPSTRLRTIDEINTLYARIGVKENAKIVVYCGGGVLSALEVLTLQALGKQAQLFVGSWSQWNKCPRRMALSDVQGEKI